MFCFIFVRYNFYVHVILFCAIFVILVSVYIFLEFYRCNFDHPEQWNSGIIRGMILEVSNIRGPLKTNALSHHILCSRVLKKW